MPLLALLLVAGVFGFLWYQRRTTTLTRNCRWRLGKVGAIWRCAYCGATQPGLDEPKDCLRKQAPPLA